MGGRHFILGYDKLVAVENWIGHPSRVLGFGALAERSADYSVFPSLAGVSRWLIPASVAIFLIWPIVLDV
jgi:hypothetical protein